MSLYTDKIIKKLFFLNNYISETRGGKKYIPISNKSRYNSPLYKNINFNFLAMGFEIRCKLAFF